MLKKYMLAIVFSVTFGLDGMATPFKIASEEPETMQSLFGQQLAQIITGTKGLHDRRDPRIQALEANQTVDSDSELDLAVSPVIGQQAFGGIIFWLDPSGNHGLVAARADNSSGIRWGIMHNSLASGSGIFAGSRNTTLAVVSQAVAFDYADSGVLTCANYAIAADGLSACATFATSAETSCYADWYLPSQFELSLLLSQRTLVGNFFNENYWSSTETPSGSDPAVNAWLQNVASSRAVAAKSELHRVRCIRAF